MQRERLVPAQHVEPRGARAVPDRHARGDERRRGGDLGIRDAQQHRVGALRPSATAERAVHVEAGGAQGGGQGGAEATRAHDRAGVECRDPVQFSHGRYRLVHREV
jgi:hypothetical protein